uniref:Adenylate kinase n=1 Tax=Caenorhabditis japonica TaxID=281687 RepID=A0A8R1HVD9_CAEJA
MGCTPSKPDAPDDLSGLFGPPRPIPVDIGAAIKHHLQKNTNSIVFIFGGPASQKGLIIEELTSSFNFMSISVEDIVFQYLPSRLSGTGTAIKEIQEALRNDEGMLSIDWILEMIAGRMSLAMNQRFVIDIVPAVASILKSEEYRARTHDRQLSQFEQKHPISFAIDVNVLDEQNLMRSNGETPANGRDDDSKRINPELNQMMKGADDIDRGKMEKRISEYHTCAEPFLQYFRKSNRVVKMSLSSEAVNNLVNTTRETLLKLGFTIARKDDRIICFTTCDTPETSPENIDLAYYKLKVINVNEIAKASDNLTAKICAVHRYISSHNRHDDNFLVVIPNVNVQYSEKMKRINFLEKKGLVYLDEFIKNKQHDKPPKFRTRIPVNCISSSRQQFLFFESFPNDVAKAISLLYLKQVRENMVVQYWP